MNGHPEGRPARQANLEPARRAIELFHNGQFEAMRGLLADDMVWRVPHSHPLASDIVGADNVIRFFQRVHRETEGSFQAEVIDLLANERHVVALMRMRAQRAGRQLDQRVVNVWKLRPDGKVYERELFMEDRQAADEFWSF